MSLVAVWNDEIIEINSYETNQSLSNYFPSEF